LKTRLKMGQKLIIEMLDRANGCAPKTCIMKWLFLLSRETDWGGENSPYDFVPYRYGPFSFCAYQDIAKLARLGWVEDEENGLCLLSSQGENLATQISSALNQILDEYGAYSAERLMRYSYAEYPWYALNCERRDLVVEKPMRPVAKPAIYTVGYEGSNIDEFLNTLLVRGLDGIVDIRRVPRSRVYGFHGKTLSKYLSDVGLEYLASPQLGIPSEKRRSLDSEHAMRRLLRAYRHDIQTSCMAEVEELAGVMRERPLALMCMEADPARCHRSVLADVVDDLCSLGVEHI